MKIMRAYKFRLRPTPEQAIYFAKGCGTARYAWNWTVAFCRDEYDAYLEALCRRVPALFSAPGLTPKEAVDALAAIDESSATKPKTSNGNGKSKRKKAKAETKSPAKPKPKPKRSSSSIFFMARGRAERGVCTSSGEGDDWRFWFTSGEVDTSRDPIKRPNVAYQRLYKKMCEHRDAGGMEGGATWLWETHCHTYGYAAKRIELAYKAWWDAIREGRKGGPPKFHKKGSCADSFTIQIERKWAGDRCVRVPGAGWVRTFEDPNARIPKDATVCMVTVSREADRWFASITASEVEIDEPVNSGEVIGVDLGLNSIVTLSDGTQFEPPRPLEHSLRLLARRQRQHARKTPGSRGHYKSRMRVARLHAKIKNTRQDFLHKLSRDLVERAHTLVIEGFDVTDLVSKGVAKTEKGKRKHDKRREMLDMGWGEFRRQATYKGQWYGCNVLICDEYKSTDKPCYKCGTINATKRTSRYECSGCGNVTTRQANTALLLESFGRGNPPESTGGHPEPDARGGDGSAAFASSLDETRTPTTKRHPDGRDNRPSGPSLKRRRKNARKNGSGSREEARA